MKSIYQAKVTNSVANILALIIGKFALYSIFTGIRKALTFLKG
jgi:miniconductance mechanosensitive channel